MTNSEIISKLDVLVPRERKLTSEILALIREADRRRLYLDLGFPNIYKWLIEKYGYSQSAAHRRIQAARLLAVLPEAEEKLVAGSLNLTTLSQVQTTLRKEELRTGEKISVEAKRELILKIENKSSDEAQKLLVTEFPEAQASESLRFINESESKLSAVLNDDARKWLERVKELMSHTHPNAAWSDVICHLAKQYVEQNDPLMRPVKTKSNGKGARTAPADGAAACKSAVQPVNKIADVVSEASTREATDVVSQTSGAITQDDPVPVCKQSADAHSVDWHDVRLTPTTAPQPPHQHDVPTDRPTSAARAASQSAKLGWQAKRRIVLQRAGGACEFRDHASGQVCGSRFQIEVDHLRPRALGGGDELSNLRALCRRHNLLMAERSLGLERMMRFRN